MILIPIARSENGPGPPTFQRSHRFAAPSCGGYGLADSRASLVILPENHPGRRRCYNKQLSNVMFRLTGEMTWIRFCPAITPHRSNFTKTGLGIGAKLGPGEWTTAVCPREDIEHKRVCRVRECWDGCRTYQLQITIICHSVGSWVLECTA